MKKLKSIVIMTVFCSVSLLSISANASVHGVTCYPNRNVCFTGTQQFTYPDGYHFDIGAMATPEFHITCNSESTAVWCPTVDVRTGSNVTVGMNWCDTQGEKGPPRTVVEVTNWNVHSKDTWFRIHC